MDHHDGGVAHVFFHADGDDIQADYGNGQSEEDQPPDHIVHLTVPRDNRQPSASPSFFVVLRQSLSRKRNFQAMGAFVTFYSLCSATKSSLQP
jgi:hypothetical protein